MLPWRAVANKPRIAASHADAIHGRRTEGQEMPVVRIGISIYCIPMRSQVGGHAGICAQLLLQRKHHKT